MWPWASNYTSLDPHFFISKMRGLGQNLWKVPSNCHNIDLVTHVAWDCWFVLFRKEQSIVLGKKSSTYYFILMLIFSCEETVFSWLKQKGKKKEVLLVSHRPYSNWSGGECLESLYLPRGEALRIYLPLPFSLPAPPHLISSAKGKEKSPF